MMVKSTIKNIISFMFAILFIVALFSVLLSCCCFQDTAFADDKVYLINSVDELMAAIISADDGDTILVDDIEFNKMPAGMIRVPKNITIKSGKTTKAIFSNATLYFRGTTSNNAPLSVNLENIDFRGDNYGKTPDSTTNISSSMPDVMNTMCAGIFDMNIDVKYSNCTFEGYHYGYGGVFNAKYTSNDNQNECKITIDNCIFQNNAAKFGGCIYLSSYNQNITLIAKNCTFENNAATYGGAIWSSNSKIALRKCIFENNSYIDTETIETITKSGGAIATKNTSLSLDACVISNNVSGGVGGGIACQISPFNTLIMQNCTVSGNKAETNGAISIDLLETNLDTSANAYVYFCSIANNTSVNGTDLMDNEHIKMFGCFIEDNMTTDFLPNEENGYCIGIQKNSIDKYIVQENGHIVPVQKFVIPKDAASKIAGGKFASNIGEFCVGDNYADTFSIKIVPTPTSSKTVTLHYGEKYLPETPTRKGYSFEGWELNGNPVCEEIVCNGGIPNFELTAKWKWQLSQNTYVIWLPALLVFCTLILLLFVKIKKAKKVYTTPEEELHEKQTEDKVLPDNWIDLVFEKSEINDLSNRERDVLRKLLEGKSRKQIADELFVSESAIRKHSSNIYAKLNVHNRTELLYKLTQ